jgi:thiamine pyrophosphate-dependent acetolactate synthase large subunit-like protein
MWRVVDPAPRQLPAPDAVNRAIRLLAGAQRPLVVLGKGAAYAQADHQIKTFIETTGLPFLPMSMAKGLLPDNHPQSVAAARSLALREADVVMLLGARLNWLLGHGEAPQWNPDAKFIQVDIDPMEFDSRGRTCRCATRLPRQRARAAPCSDPAGPNENPGAVHPRGHRRRRPPLRRCRRCCWNPR